MSIKEIIKNVKKRMDRAFLSSISMVFFISYLFYMSERKKKHLDHTLCIYTNNYILTFYKLNIETIIKISSLKYFYVSFLSYNV